MVFVWCRLLSILLLASAWVVTAASGESDQLSPPERPFVAPNRWALVIGASNYAENLGRLRYTAKEARDFAAFLDSDLAFEPGSVKLLADGGTPEEAPTSKHILDTLDAMLSDRRLDKSNLFIFYFSGHGMGTEKGDFLLPSDIEKGRETEMGIPVDSVIRRIVAAGLKNVLILADACRAGQQNDFGSELTALCRKSNLAVILGCAPGKRSYEYPSLKQSAFTHALIDVLRDPATRDASGSLWASAVGARVTQQVKDFTEKDYGKYAQVPAVWAESSTLDILLAAYPSATLTNEEFQMFLDRSKQFDPRNFANACFAYATTLFDRQRYDRAVELLDIVDKLDQATPASNYLFGVALQGLGRQHEANKVFDRLRNGEPGYWSDLATITAGGRDLDPRLRLQAASRFLASSTSWPEQYLSYLVAKRRGTNVDRLAFAKKLAACKPQTAKQRYVALAEIADAEGRYSDAVKLLAAARQQPGAQPGADMLHWLELEPVTSSGNEKWVQEWLARGLKTSDGRGFTLVLQAARARDRGDTKTRLEFLKKALAEPLEPDRLVDAAQVAGTHIMQFADSLKDQAHRQPYCWQSQLVLFFLATMEKDSAAADAAARQWDLYCDDPVVMTAKVSNFMESFLEESVLAGKASNADYSRQVEKYFYGLRAFVDQFGFDADLWGDLIRYGLTSGHTRQVSWLVDRYLKFKPDEAPTDLRPILMFVDLNTRVGPSVGKLWKPEAFSPSDRTDFQWVWAAYQACVGKRAEAAKTIAALPNPSPRLQPIADGLRAYLAAAEGKRAVAVKLLGKPTGHLVEQGLQGLAWAELGDWKRAEPLLRKQMTQTMWSFLFIQRFALDRLDRHYLAMKSTSKHREVAYAVSLAHPGNPVFAGFTFLDKPDVAKLKGTIDLTVGIRMEDATVAKGRLRLAVGADGACEGRLTDETKASVAFKARVDGFGNLTGTVVLGKVNYRLEGKIAPPAVYASFPSYGTTGQFFVLTSDRGIQIQMVGWPGDGPAGALTRTGSANWFGSPASAFGG